MGYCHAADRFIGFHRNIPLVYLNFELLTIINPICVVFCTFKCEGLGLSFMIVDLSVSLVMIAGFVHLLIIEIVSCRIMNKFKHFIPFNIQVMFILFILYICSKILAKTCQNTTGRFDLLLKLLVMPPRPRRKNGMK